MPHKRLNGVIVAFDIDNTLADPTGEAYGRTVMEFLLGADLRLAGDDPLHTFEQVRSYGSVLERLGLGNPIHERGHPHGLALLCMTHCENPALLRELNIHKDDRAAYGLVLRKLRELDHAARHGQFHRRLEAEITLRRALRDRPEAVRLQSEIERVGGHPIVTRWCATPWAECEAEHGQKAGGVPELLHELESAGAITVVISEGRRKVQQDKLDGLGLSEHFARRILITEDATDVPGVHRLREAIAGLIGERLDRASPSDEDELALLWHYHCLIDAWSGKTPWFFGRCLHAIRNSPEAPEEGFGTPLYVAPDRWREEPLRFVMVGDRYDKDIRPLIDLLGPEAGFKVRLRAGKYGHLDPEEDLPAEHRPNRTFSDWPSLARFLTDELRAADVPPITAPPDIVPRGEVRRNYLERGLDSSHEAVRLVAEAVAEMMGR
jgi:FMN phosphatase YigB (HAD superfamily)